MSIISTKKLLISLIVVMGIIVFGITNPAECANWEHLVKVSMHPGETSERFVPTGSDSDAGTGTITKFLLHQRDGSNITNTNLDSSYSNGVTSFLGGKIKLITK